MTELAKLLLEKLARIKISWKLPTFSRKVKHESHGQSKGMGGKFIPKGETPKMGLSADRPKIGENTEIRRGRYD